MPAKKTKTTKKAPAKKVIRFPTPGPKPKTHVVVGYPVTMGDFFAMDAEPSCAHEPPEGAKFCPKCGKTVVRAEEPTPTSLALALFGQEVTFAGFVAATPSLETTELRVFDLSQKGDQSALVLGRYLCFDDPATLISLSGAQVRQVLLVVAEKLSGFGFHDSRLFVVTTDRGDK